jgi:hypothetical protein
VGQILLAGEEPYERSALLRDLIADRPAQHRIAGLEGVEDRALRDRPLDVEIDIPSEKEAAASVVDSKCSPPTVPSPERRSS